MFILAIYPIVRRIEREFYLELHRWYADDGLIGGKVDEVRRAMSIIDDDGAKIIFLLQPTEIKAYRLTQCPSLLEPLTSEFELDFKPLSDGIKSLHVLQRSMAFVRDFTLAKFDSIDDSIRLTITIDDGRAPLNIYGANVSKCKAYLDLIVAGGSEVEAMKTFDGDREAEKAIALDWAS